MILFETDKKPLSFLLDQIDNRELALPDFQRSFVWDPAATRELVVSIIRSFPAGSLLLMQGGAHIFAPREFEKAPSLGETTPSYLVLDGQQRLTSLSQAFGARGSHRFFLNLRDLIEGYDLDEAVEVHPARRADRWLDLASQASDLMLPLSQLRAFADWKDEVLEILQATGDDDLRKLKKQLNEIEAEYVKPVELYHFPVTTLSASTPVEAVCTIFETLNRTGVKLSVFELITARAFAQRVKLRDMWDAARERFLILQDFQIDPYYVLQTIALILTDSPKRSVVLSLPIEDVVAKWDRAIRGLTSSLTLLRDECGVLVSQWLPYATMLNSMGAAWEEIATATGPATGARKEKMKRWFWCSVFGATYENAPNSASERDVPELRAWLQGGPEPTAVRTFSFDPRRWMEVTVRQRALYRGSIALLMRHSPLDFHEAIPLSKPIIDGKSVDDHHVFPRAYLSKAKKTGYADTVLNHTLIDRKTNIRISGRAPSLYLGEMERELGPKLDDILRSHRLPAGADGPLFQDRFEDFLSWRLDVLTKELAEAAGATLAEDILRNPARTADPFQPSHTPVHSDDQNEFLDLETPEAVAGRTDGPELLRVLRESVLGIAGDISESANSRGALIFRTARNRRFLVAVPLKDRLRLGLGLVEPFEDPGGLAHKLTRPSGVWAYDTYLITVGQLPEVMGLIRQAYEAKS